MQTDLKINSKESDEVEILSILVKNYEDTHYVVYVVDKPNPIDAIKFRLDQMGETDSFLSKILGAYRKSEILSDKRKLNLPQIRKLSNELHISADVLVQEY